MAEKLLSIVVPTFQRAQLLERCLLSVERGTHCDFELIVVDGASHDATQDVLERARQRLGGRLQVIREEQRQGFTKAVNRGLRAATGRFITWLNDDARPMLGTLDEAVGQMQDAKADVGLLALFHRWQGIKNVAYETSMAGRCFRLLHVRGTLFANFGVARRETFGALGFFDDRFYVQSSDADFSMKVWHSGMRVEPAYMTAIDHDELYDARRDADETRVKADYETLLAKWDFAGRNPDRDDFDPAHPCTLRGRHDQPKMAV
jgi:O-antigen biosynthesis protein